MSKRRTARRNGDQNSSANQALRFQETAETPTQNQPDAPTASEEPVSRRRRIIISVLVVFHLCAVVLPPLAVQTFGLSGPSPLIGILIRPFEGYGQFLHMDRGYAFFAPDPGPSRLIQAAVIEKNGQVSETIYPDLQNQWPRLLYHRHFMLSEYLSEVYYPPGPPDELFEADRFEADLWQQRRGRYEFIRQSMVDHLSTVNDGKEVAIRRLEHGLPALEDYQIEPIELTDPRLYSVLVDQPIISDSIAPQTEESNNESAEEIPAPLLDDSEEAVE